MKIVQYCDYTFPATNQQGGERIVERLTRGLLELGHEVVMKLNSDSKNTPAPLVSEIPKDFDIIHFHSWTPNHNMDSHGLPWVTTIHGGGIDGQAMREGWHGNSHIICVSKFVSDRSNCPAYVWSCTDPSEFIFSENKDDYFLWMAGTDWADGKGLFTSIMLAKKLRFKLKLAGIGKNKEIINQIKKMCDDKIEYIGAINGEEKAEILSKAKALILLTKLPDACPATVGEALMSGTPIIASSNGAMPELINSKIGFICKNENQVAKAILNIKKIKSKDCLEYGLNNFSHIKCSEKFLQFYNNMINFGKVL